MIPLKLVTEHRVLIGTPVDQRSGSSVDDRGDVLTGDRLVRLQCVRHGEDLGPVVREQPVGLVVELGQFRVHLLAELGVEECPVRSRFDRLSAAHPAERHGPRRDRISHRVVGEHLGRDRRRAPHVSADAGRVISFEEEPFARERRQEGHDVDIPLGSPFHELVLGWDRRYEPPDVPTSFDRGDVDNGVLPQAIGHHRMASLVDRDRVPLPLDVLVVVRQAVLLQLLRLDDVAPRDGVTAVADRDHERLVDRVLDQCT